MVARHEYIALRVPLALLLAGYLRGFSVHELIICLRIDRYLTSVEALSVFPIEPNGVTANLPREYWESFQPPGICPQRLALHTTTPCILGAVDSCRIGYATCMVTSNGVPGNEFPGCCVTWSTGIVQNYRVCPNDLLPDMRRGANFRGCTYDSQCSVGYECRSATDGSGMICCQGPRCPGGVTIGQQNTGQPLKCYTPGYRGLCPLGQTCRQSINSYLINICCPA